ncbi:MAG: hypothetical protein J5J00_07280 [Deltaproteobacteria bacterium]|nr:hypothetical protein [Deltaproteobacteria bacterium]
MKGRRILLTFVRGACMIGLAVFASLAAAAPKSRIITIDAPIEVGFYPEEAFLLIDVDRQGLKKIRGVLVPPFTEDESTKAGGQWTVGTQLEVPAGARQADFAVFVKGRDKQYALLAGMTEDLSSPEAESDVKELTSHLEQRKELLMSWQVQAKAQDDNLKRLRADADVIANVARIVDVLEQIEAAKYEHENLEKDIATLHELLKQAKDQPAPKNYARRELELTKQIAQLAQLVKDAESKEGARRLQSQSDLQRKLAVVEATRFDDEKQLTQQLTQLKERRAAMEKAGYVEAPKKEANYWESQ